VPVYQFSSLPVFLNIIMLLFINTNSKDKIYFILSNKRNEKSFYKEYPCNFMNSQDILSFLENFIVGAQNFAPCKKEIFFKLIDAIIIDNGPGINMNFRIGIVITNTIAYLYNINIVNILKTEYNNIEEFVKIGWERFNKKNFVKLIIPEYSIK
jgi:tRNA A37 threonylcarbamoyladenosine modification protein TsaB